MPQNFLYWCTEYYIQWGHLQLPLVTALLSSNIGLDDCLSKYFSARLEAVLLPEQWYIYALEA